MTPDYVFRPMTTSDLPLVRRWLAEPHVVQWWGNTLEQFELVSGDLEVEAMEQFVVAINDRPFGYLQCYDPDVWPENGLGAHPRGTRGIDQFIGEQDMVDRGHGSAFIRTFIDRLLAPVRHASSPIQIRPTAARYALMKRPDFAASIWSTPPMVRRS
jgi:aminoglycoside 6'-N-acetyltransferase